MCAMNKSSKTLLGKKELSQFWFCPFDENILQERHSRVAQNPIFLITRQKINIGVNNAIAMKKIPEEAATYTRNMANTIFQSDDSITMLEFVSVICKKCGKWLSAPILSEVEGVDVKHVQNILIERSKPIYYGKYTNKCLNCQKENDSKYKFCIHCGSKIEIHENLE